MTLLGITLSDLIERGGAYAGIAAFFGLAVLVILYFAQARELKRLREWAGRAPERAQEVEERVIAQADAARAARPGKVAAARPVAAAAGGAAAAQAKPAAKPAPGQPLTAAAKAAPGEPVTAAAKAAPGQSATGTPQPGTPQPGQPATGTPQPATPGQPAVAGATAMAATTPGETATPADGATTGDGDAAAATPDGATTGDGDAPTPAPDGTPAQSDGPGQEDTPAATPAEGTPAPVAAAATAAGRAATGNGAGSAGPTIPRAGARPTPRPATATLRANQGASRRPTAHYEVEPEPERKRPWALIGGIASAAIVVVVLLVIFLGGGDSGTGTPTADGTATPAASATRTPKGTATPATLTKANTDVAVLNGTTVPRLAATVGQRVEAEGYSEPKTGNWIDNVRSASVVFYMSSAARSQAIALGKLLSIGTVERGDSSAETVGQSADVVIVVGADQSP